MWGGEGESVGEDKFERHLPSFRSREIVCKEEVDGIALVGRQRDGPAVEFHLGLHERQTEP